jgi:hypothetical protein
MHVLCKIDVLHNNKKETIVKNTVFKHLFYTKNINRTIAKCFSFAEPHSAPGKNLYEAPTPNLPNTATKPTFLKQAKGLEQFFLLISSYLNWYKIEWEK